MGEVPKDDGNLILFLAELAKRTVVLNPQLAFPFRRQEGSGEGDGGEETGCIPEEVSRQEARGEGEEKGVVAPETVGPEVGVRDAAGETSGSSTSEGEGEVEASE